MKKTKRHQFSFQRSCFDVLNEIPEDKDKLEFLLAIINKQFLDQNPKNLGFVANLSYQSQRHFIEKSVKGWMDRMKTDFLGNPITPPCQGVKTPPTQGGNLPPTEQEQEQEKEQEKEQEQEQEQEQSNISIYPDFNDFWELYDLKKGSKQKLKKKWDSLKQETKEEIMAYIPKYINSQPDKQFRKHPGTFLNNESWKDEIIIKTEKNEKQHQQQQIAKQLYRDGLL